MTDKRMYFGTKERMTWIKCPAYDTDLSKVGWSTSSQFINGGASVRRSATSHKVYQFAWNLASAEEIAKITAYSDGLYGQGLIYFIDPFARTTNVLPQFWANPRLAVDDGPILNGSDVRPTALDTEVNTYGYPTKSASYTLDATNSFKTLYVPIPAGYALHFGAHGTATGTAAISVASSDTFAVTNRVNYQINPSLELATTGYTAFGTGAVLSRVAATGFSGAAYGRVTAGTATTSYGVNATGSVYTVVAGEQFSQSIYVKGTVGRTVGLRVTWTGASATTSSTTTVGSTSAWQRLTYTGTVPVGATAARLDIVVSSTGVLVGDVLDFDAALSERGTNVVGTYFDGSTVATSVGNTRTANTWQAGDSVSVSQQTITVAPGVAMTMLPSSTSQLTNYSLTGVAGAYISMWGSGTLTLSGMIAQILPVGDPAPVGNFVAGQGHSGCRFSGEPVKNGYSAPEAQNFQALSATLIETGAWE